MDVAAGVSRREAEVLTAVTERLTNAEIARRLQISVRTVESHVSSLLRKLDLDDRRALARYGLELAATEPRSDRNGDARGTAGAAPIDVEPDLDADLDPAETAGLRGAPAALTSFVGRRTDLAAVLDALGESRLVNLVGPGGVGKTRLAIEAGARAAARFPGGAWFVDLVPVRDGGVATALAAAVGVTDRSDRSLDDVIAESLRSRAALLVVDNCEHVLDPAVGLLERLLLECPRLRVVTTSRELLGVSGERVVAVAPLPGDDAARLFVDRVRALDPGFAADAPAVRTVEEVCARLDGIPLAIELASARCAVLGLDGVWSGLADRLGLLSGARRADDRHRSLRAVLDWSHGLLDAEEQAVLRRLSVFAGDVSAADATDVVGGDGVREPAALDAIGRLTGKSLVVRHGANGTSSYRLLETVHAYAAERLDESGEGHVVRRRHLRWASGAAQAVEQRAVDGGGWRDRFDRIADDVRAALAWAATEASVAAEAHGLARAHAHNAYARRFLREAQAGYEQAASLAPDGRTAATDLRLAAATAYARMRADLAHTHLLAAAERALAEPTEGNSSAAIALADAATLAWRCPLEFVDVPPHDALAAVLERARALDPGDDPVVAAHLALAEAWSGSQRPTGDALGQARTALALARAVDDPVLVAGALDAEMCGLLSTGRVAEAADAADARLALVDRLDRHDPRAGGEIIDAGHMAAESALAAGRLVTALAQAERMRADELGRTSPHAATREAVVALTLLGRFDEAAAEADAMRGDWERAGRPQAGWMAPAAAAAALAHTVLGDPAAAVEWTELGRKVTGGGRAPTSGDAFLAFAEARAALHEARVDDARAAIAAWDPTEASAYAGYVAALAAELAVIATVQGHRSQEHDLAGAASAPGTGLEDRIAAARATTAGNAWAEACLLRAEARLVGDSALRSAATAAFAAIGAAYEAATTAALPLTY